MLKLLLGSNDMYLQLMLCLNIDRLDVHLYQELVLPCIHSIGSPWPSLITFVPKGIYSSIWFHFNISALRLHRQIIFFLVDVNCNCKNSIRLYTHDQHPIPCLDGWAVGCLSWVIGRKLADLYIKSTLYYLQMEGTAITITPLHEKMLVFTALYCDEYAIVQFSESNCYDTHYLYEYNMMLLKSTFA